MGRPAGGRVDEQVRARRHRAAGRVPRAQVGRRSGLDRDLARMAQPDADAPRGRDTEGVGDVYSDRPTRGEGIVVRARSGIRTDRLKRDDAGERFRKALDARGLAVPGVTTGGNRLCPDAMTAAFPGARQQVCEFRVLHEIMSAVLQALAAERRMIVRGAPKLPRGRPTGEAKKLARKAGDRRCNSRAGFRPRHGRGRERRDAPSVARARQGPTPLQPQCGRHTGPPERRGPRMPDVLKNLRHALKKLRSPNLEKALTFVTCPQGPRNGLWRCHRRRPKVGTAAACWCSRGSCGQITDDSLLPATSNSVERANRRRRNMQSSAYRVRTKAHVSHRIARDCLREGRLPRRRMTPVAQHGERRAAVPARRRPGAEGGGLSMRRRYCPKSPSRGRTATELTNSGQGDASSSRRLMYSRTRGA